MCVITDALSTIARAWQRAAPNDGIDFVHIRKIDQPLHQGQHANGDQARDNAISSGNRAFKRRALFGDCETNQRHFEDNKMPSANSTAINM